MNTIEIKREPGWTVGTAHFTKLNDAQKAALCALRAKQPAGSYPQGLQTIEVDFLVDQAEEVIAILGRKPRGPKPKTARRRVNRNVEQMGNVETPPES